MQKTMRRENTSWLFLASSEHHRTEAQKVAGERDRSSSKNSRSFIRACAVVRSRRGRRLRPKKR